MEKEISSSAMLGIVLIALAAVIGLGFGVFSIARGVANEGVVNVQDNLGTVQESAFTDYDNKIVTGTQVKAAYQQFMGKTVAILVNTRAMNNGVRTANGHAVVYLHAIGDDKFINYNAIIAASNNNQPPQTISDNASIPSFVNPTGLTVSAENSSIVRSQNSFLVGQSGRVVFDGNVGGWETAGSCEFIPTTGRFQANLIKDASNTTIGVTFKQLAR